MENKDILVSALARGGRVRVYVCQSTHIVKTAQKKHDLWGTATIALGRTLTIGAIMSELLKGDHQKLTIVIRGGGPIGQIMVDATSHGTVRGFVSEPHVELTYNKDNTHAVGMAVGKEGYLKVIRDIRLRNSFSGTTELISGEIAEDFAFYFAASEQIPTAVSAAVLLESDEVVSAGGIIIQMMPEATEADIVAAEAALKNHEPITYSLRDGKTPSAIAKELFEDTKLIHARRIDFRCDCSRERMYRALTVVDRDELVDMIEKDHGAEVTCNYCNAKYQFTEQELRDLLPHDLVH
ncbi:MAG: Hsp33 family molecular chaperone HslO [Erysipelotrichaceae bacterium]|jgi:molecular chaperone Hsp33|nr:Hsp33 family molecular chaperone HslO [Erysipelotrichaceae bacterium]